MEVTRTLQTRVLEPNSQEKVPSARWWAAALKKVIVTKKAPALLGGDLQE